MLLTECFQVSVNTCGPRTERVPSGLSLGFTPG